MAAGQRPRILITRPEPGASSTAKVLAARGFDPMKLQLTQVVRVPVKDGSIQGLADAAAIVVSSANAMRHAPPDVLRMISDLPIIAVGAATAAEARLQGLPRVDSVDGDADALVAYVSNRYERRAKIGYLCGRLRRDTVETGLIAGGFSTTVIETYDTEKVSYSTDKLAGIFDGFPFDGVAVFSGVSAALIAEQSRVSELSHHFEKKPLFVISDRAAEAFGDQWSGPVLVARKMNADSLHALIESYFFGSQS